MLFDWLKTLRMPQVLPVAVAVVCCLYAVSFGFFVSDYYSTQPKSWDAGALEKNSSPQFGLLATDYNELPRVISYIDSLPETVREKEVRVSQVPFMDMYCLLAMRIPAREIADQKQRDGFVQRWERYDFRYTDFYSLGAIYIVGDWKTPELDQLFAMGFSKVKRIGGYWVFANP